MFRYVTIQRGGAPTPASVFEDDSINQVGGDFIHGKSEKIAFVPLDTEFLFSLANLKRDGGRVKRSLDSIDIVYPSDSPSTDPPYLANSLLVSNDISYVYPQTFNPNRDGRQTLVEPVTVLTTTSTPRSGPGNSRPCLLSSQLCTLLPPTQNLDTNC